MKKEPINPAEIKAARARLGITQAALADYLGVTVRAVKYWEAGQRKMPWSAQILLAQLVATYAPNEREG